MVSAPAPANSYDRAYTVAWTLYGITVTQLGDLTDVVMTLDAGGTVSALLQFVAHQHLLL